MNTKFKVGDRVVFLGPPFWSGKVGVIEEKMILNPEAGIDYEWIMRRPNRGLSIGERELIASFVSKLNDCQYSFRAHAEAAKILMGEEATKFLFQEDDYHLPLRLRALLVVAVCIQSLDRKELPIAIQDAKFHGATDLEIEDTILVASFISMTDRFLEGLGLEFSPDEPEEVGQTIADIGYVVVKPPASLWRQAISKLKGIWESRRS